MKTDFFTTEKQETGEGRNLLSGLGIFCAVATVLVFSALFFSDVSLSIHSALDFGVDFALLFFSSYVMFFSLFETGKEKAMGSDEYRSLLSGREKAFCRYRSEGDTESLTRFCRELSQKETEERRAVLLSSLFLTEAEYEALKQKEKSRLTREERRALWRMKRFKKVFISPKHLLAERDAASRAAPFSHSPEELRRRRFLRFLLPTALTAFFSVSILCDVMDEPTADVIVGYLMKLFTLSAGGVKGFRSGYIHVKEEKSAYIAEQCFWLEEYFSSLAGK